MKEKISIENLLIWTYQTQAEASGEGLYPVEASAAGLYHPGVSRCGCVAAERFGKLGTMVDTSRTSAMGQWSDDAEAVNAVVMLLASQERNIALHFGISGIVPGMPLATHTPRLVPKLAMRGRGKGQPLKIYNKGRNKWIGCAVEFDKAPDLVDGARRAYAAWHRVMTLLAMELQAWPDVLKNFAVAGTEAARQPWINVGVQPGREIFVSNPSSALL